MKPVKTAITDIVYRGPGEVGDLWCHRVEPGLILSVWELTDEERAKIANGGNVCLWIHTEPIPPVALSVHDELFAQKTAEHQYKVIPELDDPERL